MSDPPPVWECRWPDPVALKVATDRLLRARSAEDATLNHALTIRVHMAPSKDPAAPVRAILVTPWGVEHVYWSPSVLGAPPVQHAVPLEGDDSGRVATGIGLLLEYEGACVPVLTAWEPEVGHYFVETLFHTVQQFSTTEEAISAALGETSVPPPKRSMADHLNRKVSRRNLLDIFRR